MSILTTIIGACAAPVDSTRPITGAALSITISYNANYKWGDGVTTRRVVTLTGSGSVSWSRIPFPRSADAVDTAPGSGLMYFAQQCCCKCRAAYIVDDQTFNTQPLTCGVVLVSVDLATSDQAYDEDGNASGDPDESTVSRDCSITLWNKLDAPCKRTDGPANTPEAHLFVPREPFSVEGDDAVGVMPGDIVLSVTGTAGVVEDTDTLITSGKPFLFATPDPCSDSQDLSCTIVKTWNLPDGTDATSTITVAFSAS